MKNICSQCPRNCLIDRKNTAGFCGEKDDIRIAKIVEHFLWEEPILSDERGTLAIFFSGCNLRCSYCQNYEISRGGVGKNFSTEEFLSLLEEKQESHSSIDLVTPTHFAGALNRVFEKFHKKIPIIWNTSGYESIQTIEQVSRFVDVFLTDFKYASDDIGSKFSACKNYHTIALPAIKKMCELKRDVFENGQMKQGVIIRHLVLPDEIENSFHVLDEISENFPQRMISLMSQFTPNGHGMPKRKLSKIEYKAVISHMNRLGLSNGYVQSLDSANENFVPDFGRKD